MLFKTRRNRRRVEREAAIEHLATCLEDSLKLTDARSERPNDQMFQLHMDRMQAAQAHKIDLAYTRVYAA